MLLALVLISLTAGSLAVTTLLPLTILPSSTDKSSALTESISPVKVVDSSLNYKYIRISEVFSTTRNSISSYPSTSYKNSRIPQNILDNNPRKYFWSSTSSTPKGTTFKTKDKTTKIHTITQKSYQTVKLRKPRIIKIPNNHTNTPSFNNSESSITLQVYPPTLSTISDPVNGRRILQYRSPIALPLHYSQAEELTNYQPSTREKTTMDVKHKLRHEHFNLYLDRMMKSRAGDTIESGKEVSQDIMRGYKSGKLTVADPTKVRRRRNHPERIVGLTTPSKYEIKRYRKPEKRNKKHEKRYNLKPSTAEYNDQKTLFDPYILEGILYGKNVVERPDFSLQNGAEWSEPYKRFESGRFIGRSRLQPTDPTRGPRAWESFRKRLANVAKSTTKFAMLMDRAEHSKISEIEKNKTIHKFLKFIKKNRALVEKYVASRQARKSRRRLGETFDGDLRISRLVTLPLELSPARDKQIDIMRLKNRICQRNVLVPEGPKYDSMGNMRRPAFTPKPGRPDFPVTKEATFRIPVCCNCCKKSLLGCG